MHVLRFDRPRLGWALPLLLLLPGGLGAQLRTVISNEIAVSGREAALHLDFENIDDLNISLREGEVLVNGDVVGGFARGDALDLAWRSLLGDVISLDDGPLANALYDWSPAEELEGSAAELAATLDLALEDALALPEAAQDQGPSAEISLTLSDESSLLGALLSRTGALRGLSEALQEASVDDFVLKIGEDLEVGAGEELSQSVVLVDGDLELRGLIRGDVVVTGGSVQLMDGGRITGDLRVVDGEVEELGGEVGGRIFEPTLDVAVGMDAEDIEDLREDLEREIRRDILSSFKRDTRSSHSWFGAFFGNVGRAIGGLLENLLTFFVLAILGVLIVHFGRERLEVVATTARRAPAQSAMVGLAGGFLLIPVWILGVVALAISIIGIPVLLAWVPLFPIAAGVAALLGYVAVARNIGDWVADQEYRGLEWIRGSNVFYAVVAGLGALMIPAVAASAVRILGLGLLQGLLGFVGSAVTFAALAVGFGAVLLTRGGRIRPYAAYYDYEEDWWGESGEGEAVEEEGHPEDPVEPEGAEGNFEEAPGPAPATENAGEGDHPADNHEDPGSQDWEGEEDSNA